MWYDAGRDQRTVAIEQTGAGGGASRAGLDEGAEIIAGKGTVEETCAGTLSRLRTTDTRQALPNAFSLQKALCEQGQETEGGVRDNCVAAFE
jgi:hypothetical protein